MQLNEIVSKILSGILNTEITIDFNNPDWLEYNFNDYACNFKGSSEFKIVCGYIYKNNTRVITILFDKLYHMYDNTIKIEDVKYEILNTNLFDPYTIKYPDFTAQERAMFELTTRINEQNYKIAIHKQKFLRLHKQINVNGYLNMLFKTPDDFIVNSDLTVNISIK